MADTTIQNVAGPEPAAACPAREVRLPAFVAPAGDLSRALDKLDVAVVGAGSVGQPTCIHLARLQPRSLLIVDPGYYKPENLLTQNITPDAIGRNKAEYTGQLCARISPMTRVRVFAGRAEQLPLAAFCSLGLVMLATDNLKAEVEVAMRCVQAGAPLVQGSVHGDFLVAQIRFCGNADGNGPCLTCGFGHAELQHLSQETVFSCQGGDYDADQPLPANRAATMSTSSLCSLAADLALMQVLRHLGGLGAPVADTLLEYSGYTHRTTVSPLQRNDQCPCEHRRWERCLTQRELAAYTPRELANIALGHVRTANGISLNVDNLQFCEDGICTRCGSRQPVETFVKTLRGCGKCAECGDVVDGLPFRAHRPAPLTVLGKRADRPLRESVKGAPESIVVRGPHKAVLCECSAARRNRKNARR